MSSSGKNLSTPRRSRVVFVTVFASADDANRRNFGRSSDTVRPVFVGLVREKNAGESEELPTRSPATDRGPYRLWGEIKNSERKKKNV